MDGIRNHLARRKSYFYNSQGSSLRTPAVENCNQFKVSRKGWLHRLEGSALKQWKRRWFVLGDYCLFYYKDLKEEKLLGSVLLPSYRVSPCDSSQDGITRKFSFKLEHQNMKSYFLAADSKESMDQWMTELKLASNMQFNYGSNSFTQSGQNEGNNSKNNQVFRGKNKPYGPDENVEETFVHERKRFELSNEKEFNQSVNLCSSSNASTNVLDETYTGSYNDIGLPPVSRSFTSLPTSFGFINSYFPYLSNCSYINAPPKPKRHLTINGENGDIYNPVRNFNSYLCTSYHQPLSSLSNGTTPDLIAHNSTTSNSFYNSNQNSFFSNMSQSNALLNNFQPRSSPSSSTSTVNYSIPPLSATSVTSTSNFLFDNQDISSFHQSALNQTGQDKFENLSFSCNSKKRLPRPHSADFLEREQKDEEEMIEIENTILQNEQETSDANYYSKPKQDSSTNSFQSANILPIRPKSSLERYDPYYFNQSKEDDDRNEFNAQKIQSDKQNASLVSSTLPPHRPWSDYLKEKNQKYLNESTLPTSESIITQSSFRNFKTITNSDSLKNDSSLHKEESFERLLEWKKRMLVSSFHKRNKSNEKFNSPDDLGLASLKPAKLKISTPVNNSLTSNSRETKYYHEKSRSFAQHDTFGLNDEGHVEHHCSKFFKSLENDFNLIKTKKRDETNSPDYINIKVMHQLDSNGHSSASFSNLMLLDSTRSGGDGQESEQTSSSNSCSNEFNLTKYFLPTESTLNDSSISDWNKIGLPSVDSKSTNYSKSRFKSQSTTSLFNDSIKLAPTSTSKLIEKKLTNSKIDQEFNEHENKSEFKNIFNDKDAQDNLKHEIGSDLSQVEQSSKTLKEDKNYFPPNLVKDRIKSLENKSASFSSTLYSKVQKQDSYSSFSNDSKFRAKEKGEIISNDFSSNLYQNIKNIDPNSQVTIVSEQNIIKINECEASQIENKILDESTSDPKSCSQVSQNVLDNESNLLQQSTSHLDSSNQLLASSKTVHSLKDAKLFKNVLIKDATFINNEQQNLVPFQSCCSNNATSNQATLNVLNANPAYESFTGISGTSKFETGFNPVEIKKEVQNETETKQKSSRNVNSAPYYYSDLLSDEDDHEGEEKFSNSLKFSNRRKKLSNLKSSKSSTVSLEKCDLSRRVNLFDLIPEDYGLKFLDAERNKYNAGSTLEKVPENRKIIINPKISITSDSFLEKNISRNENKIKEQAFTNIEESQASSCSVETLEEDHFYENLEALNDLHRKQKEDQESLFNCDHLRKVSQNYFTIDTRIGAVRNTYFTNSEKFDKEENSTDRAFDSNLVRHINESIFDQNSPNFTQELKKKNNFDDFSLSLMIDKKDVQETSMDQLKCKSSLNCDSSFQQLMIQECNPYDYPLSNRDVSQFFASSKKLSFPNVDSSDDLDWHKASVSKPELMNKTYDELVLLLIQLRRNQTHLLANCDQLRLQMESEEKLMEIEPLRKEEHRVRCNELKEKLVEAEQKYDSQYPLIEMVDNMVKLNAPSSSHQNVLQDLNENDFKTAKSFSSLFSDVFLNSQNIEKNQLDLSAQTCNSKLVNMDDVTMEQERLIKILEQDKNVLDKTLETVRSSMSTLPSQEKSSKKVITVEHIKQQETILESELEKVRGLLAQSSLRLEERENENASIEQAKANLNQSLTSLSSFISESQNIVLEEELASIDQAIDDLYAKRQEILESYKKQKVSETSLIVRASPTGLAGSAPLPEKKKKFSTYFETDLNTMESRDLAQFATQKNYYLGNDQQLGPLYENLEKTAIKVPSNSKTISKSDETLEKNNENFSVNSNFDQSIIKFHQEKLPNTQINQNSFHIKTVRLVKRECERRKSENLGKILQCVDGQDNFSEELGSWKGHQEYKNVPKNSKQVLTKSFQTKVENDNSNSNNLENSDDALVLSQESKTSLIKNDDNNNNSNDCFRSSLSPLAPPDIVKSTIKK